MGTLGIGLIIVAVVVIIVLVLVYLKYFSIAMKMARYANECGYES